MISASKTKSGEAHEIYRNLCIELNMDSDMLEVAWRAYRSTRLEENTEPGETAELEVTAELEETTDLEETTGLEETTEPPPQTYARSSARCCRR